MNLKLIKEQVSCLNQSLQSLENCNDIPQIEIDILKNKLQQIYTLLCEEPTSTPKTECEDSNLPTPEPTVEKPKEEAEEVVVAEEIIVEVEEDAAEAAEESEQIPEFDPEEVKRLHYINVLFKGDKEFYAQQMDIINNFETFEDVLIYISENFSWSQSDETAQLFVDTIATKFN